MQINHIGYAVKSISKAIENLAYLGFEFGDVIEDTDRNILIAFGKHSGYVIELVSPISNDKESPIDGVIKKNGSTVYHICYESDNIKEDVKMLEKKQFKIIKPLEPAIAFSGRQVVFLYNPIIGIIEIVEV